MDHVTVLPEGVSGPPVFRDGFGDRFLAIDPEAGDPIEILAFDPALVGVTEFGSAVGVRVARVAGARHALFARARRIDRPAADALLLVSDRVAGWRLADVLDIAHRVGLTFDASAVLNLLRQLVPAVALFGRHQRDLTVGNIGPERLILTPQGRLVLAEYVLGDAIDKLGLTRDELWRTFRVPVVSLEGTRDAARSDVLAIGLVALSLFLGRRLREDEFPFAVGDLLQRIAETHGSDSRPLSGGLATWLGRALQLEGYRPLQSAKEAQVAFEELLATERAYVTSPALLEAFIAQFEQRAGPPAEPTRPVAAKPMPGVVEEPKPPQIEEAVPEIPSQPAPADSLTLEPSSRPELSWAPKRPEYIWEPPVPEPTEVAAATADGQGADDAERVSAPEFTPEDTVTAEAEGDSTSDAAESSAPEPPLTSETGPARPSEPVLPSTSVEQPPVIPTAALSGHAAEQSRSWMTKALAGLALLVVLEAAAIFWLWNRSATALVRDGELTVQTRPAAARVTLDDDDLGVTPVTVRLAPGTYTLKVQMGNAEPRVILVQIRAGVQTAQYLELQSGR